MKWGYLFRADPSNPGDWYSSPMNYLPDDRQGVIIDVFLQNVAEIDVDVLVIGGGALFTNKKFLRHLEHVLSHIQARHRIVWGVGFEPKKLDSSVFDQFDLFATREYNLEGKIDWVPCASVLHPIFNLVESTKPMHDFLVVDHFKRTVPFDRPHTRIINKPNHITAVIQAIAEHRFIVTSSYHVAYWSALLERPCAVIGNDLPGKFFHFKHPPIINNNWNDDLVDQACVWTEARSESLQANLQYIDSINHLIETSKSTLDQSKDIIL